MLGYDVITLLDGAGERGVPVSDLIALDPDALAVAEDLGDRGEARSRGTDGDVYWVLV